MDINETARAYEPPADALAGRNIMITGVTGGIGRALGLGAAALGARVIGTGRNVKALSSFGDAVVQAGYPEPVLVPLNLAGAGVDDYAELAGRLGDAVGALHGLVLNAGMLGPMSAIRHYDPAEWARVMHVNVNSSFMLTRAMLPLLERAAEASIVFTSSSLGRRGRALWGAYAASKFAMEGLMQVLADETRDTGIRVNSINPGATATRMRAEAYPAEDPRTLPAPDDILAPFLYLLGPDSAGLRGEALNAQSPR